MNLRPLLVIGPGRGGTSLLTACLGGHPCIVMHSEYHSVSTLHGDDQPIRSIATMVDDRLDRLRSLCDEDRARHPGLIWGNKITTEHIRGLEEHNFLNRQPRGRGGPLCPEDGGIPPDLHHSRRPHLRRTSKFRRAGRPLMRAALLWCYSVRVLEGLGSLGALCTTVRYEELVQRPAAVLTNVCHALEIDFHPNMLDQTNNEQLLMPEYRHGRFLAEKATEIPLLPDAVLNVIEPDLRRLGYL